MTHSRKREFKTRRKKLFRNILNEKGPTIEACRKPVIIIPLEQQLFLTFTLCCRLSKQLCNLRRLILVRLRFAGFAFFKKIPRKFISMKFVIFSYPQKKKKKNSGEIFIEVIQRDFKFKQINSTFQQFKLLVMMEYI